uniref:BTB domain-containing protein n=1 Tax=Globodera rostochiensis TaxID=31243 RepID=A0A914I7T8_GLORO
MDNVNDGDNLYDKYSIVAEQSAVLDGHSSISLSFGNFFCEFFFNGTKCLGHFRTTSSYINANTDCLVEIVIWQWNEGNQTIVQRNLINFGQSKQYCIDRPVQSMNIFVRTLAKKQILCQNTYSSANSSNDDLIVMIGDRQITVSAAQLMSVSPVFDRMLSVEMVEKKRCMVKLEGIEMEQFMAFLEAISGSSLPNPHNVLDLLAMADYFMVDWLKDRCDAQLINCLEMPLIDRFLLIERFRLDRMKKLFSQRMDLKNLQHFRKNKENFEKIYNGAVSVNLICHLALRVLVLRSVEENKKWIPPKSYGYDW